MKGGGYYGTKLTIVNDGNDHTPPCDVERPHSLYIDVVPNLAAIHLINRNILIQ